MFSNLMLFRIEAGWPQSLTELQDALMQEAFSPCSATQQKATGWVPVRGQNHGEFAESVAGQWIAKFTIETKAVPADALRRRVDELAQQIEATTGRVPGKREKKDLRDDALQELLPHAFPKQSSNWVWLDPESRILALDAASPGRADEITSSLTRVAGRGFGLRLIQTHSTPQSVMAHWLGSEEADAMPSDFALGRECELKGGGEEPAMVKFKRHDLSTDEVRQHLADGKLPIALAVNWEDRVRFTLTEALVLKKIGFDDSVFADAGDDDDRFDTDITIKTAELQALIASLLQALGGEQAPGALPGAAPTPAAALSAGATEATGQAAEAWAEGPPF
ncbi:recombination-associated protein RdgC [Comamonas serinivorans]|nr:recombination-associated protein RdgC [Comamonas serinivorans]